MKKLLQQCKTFLARNSKLLMIFLFLFLTCIVKAQTFTITTDQDDYYPGEWVIINGSGWIPGDSVKLSITHVGDSIPNHIHAPWILVVDANGNLFDEWYVAEMELNTTLWLQAQSLSTASMYAEKVFTDASYLMVSGTVQFANGIPISGVTVKGYKDSGLTIEEGRSNSRSSDGVWSLTLSKDAVRYVVVTPPIGYSPSNVILSSPPSGGIISRISSNEFRISSGPNGGTSTGNQFILVLNNSVPAISSISPNNKCAGDAAFTLSVSGTNFIPTSTVKFNGSSRPTTYINSGLLSASINATDIAQSISASITVSNPAPGGGTSSGSTLMVKALPSAPIVESNSFVYDGNNHFVTAKVDAGEEIYWFDAPTGGNLLSEIPSLNTVGSITAYAESRNKITGCVSTTRTSITLTITARPITITADAQNKIYGDTDPVLTDKVTNGSVIPGDIASGSLTRAAGENVGSYAISKGTCTYGSNYNETFVGANLVISQRPVTITPDSGLTKVYGSPDPVFAYTSSEALISGNSFSGTLGRAAGENVAAGPYAYSLGTLSAGSNYSLTLGGSSTFIISKAPSVTTVNTNNATYDAHPHGGTATVTGVGGLSQSLLVTYSGSGTSQYGPTTSAPTNASSYNAAGSYAGDANHEPSADNKDFTIAPAQATITVAGYTGVYDASPHGASPTSVLGAPEDDLRSFVSLGESFTNVPGGTAHWSFSNPNYISQSGDVAISISKTTSFTEVTITGAPFTYTGSAIMPASVSVTGAGGLNLTPDPVYADNFNAGTATASYSYAGDANHEPSSDSETFTIGKAASATVVSISGAPFTYTGSAIMPASVSVTGAGGLNLTPDPVYADNINAGTATASYPYAGDANHEPSSDSETFTIGKANAIILVTPYTVTYDGLSHKAAFSATGVEPIPADLSSLIDISATEHTNAASYPNDAWSFAGNENYNAASGTVSDAIAKANAVISVTPYSITYDGLTHKAVFSAAGVEPAPADLSSLLDISATEHTNAGIYSADAWSFAGNENYNSAGGTINDIIGQRSITITADAKSKTYGDTDPALTAQVTSGTIVGSDAASGTLARAAGENVGAYAISKATYTYGINYNETFVGDNLVIGQRPITITVDANQFKYCGQADPLPFGYSISGRGLAGGDACAGALQRSTGECSNFYPINIGSHTIVCGSINKESNYAITFNSANFEIKGVSIDASASSTPVQLGSVPQLKAKITPEVAGVLVNFNVESGNGTNTVYSVKTDPSGLANIGGTGLTSVDVYKVIASIGDNCTSSTAAYLAVYDPSGGFVTGGGWINSPAGAYKSNGNLTGKANFGFNSKYQKGKNIPDGNTEFQFQAGNLNFSSSTYSLGSLVISGAKATYRGVGTINGSGNYAFMVSVIDGNITGGGGYDKFRIKIWNANDVIYDNNMGLDENEVPTISLGGGSIVIHNDKTKSAEIPQIQLTGEQNVVSCNVVVPNGFSPNGDGLNDYFKISCLQDYPDAALKIYTPAGKLVFEQQRYGNLSFWGSEDAAWWNGCIGSNTSGAALPSGSYVYILELNPLKKEAVKTGVVFINK